MTFTKIILTLHSLENWTKEKYMIYNTLTES